MTNLITVVLPDGTNREIENGSTVADLALSIGAGLAKAALAGKINEKLVDLSCKLEDGDIVAIITNKSEEALDLLRHSSAHLLAAALCELYGDVKFGVGPSVENGFYYDIDCDKSISPEDIDDIEAKMRDIVKSGAQFQRKVVSRSEALDIFSNQPYKLELINELDKNELITTYTLGNFVDLCRGPHVPSVSNLGAFKITKLAGAYWRGDSDREMLQRVYGTAFFNKKDLEAYITQLEEAEKRDHRKLGRELGIYINDSLAGPGLPLYLPNGARVIRTMQEWLRKDLYARGYEEVITPHIYNADVWKTSGHYNFYKENMYFFNIDEGTEKTPRLVEHAIKPMNCPGHVMLFRSSMRSYRELPLRYFEFGTVYRHEMSGAVHGLMRARGFTQDDAHVFCTKDQLIDEVVSILDLVDHIMTTFDFEYSAEISTRPDKSIGTDEMWEHATQTLIDACSRRKLAFDINEGDGAFYGPKIDIKVKDAIGRSWQCSTVQVDFNMPQRFNLTYKTEDNTDEQPWMLHRAIFGSIERFLGILIEHYTGAFPLWLAPLQLAILPLADRHIKACEQLQAKVKAVGGRVEIFSQNEPMRVKIAKVQAKKVPYMAIIGDKEIELDSASIRHCHDGELGLWSFDKIIETIKEAQV